MYKFCYGFDMIVMILNVKASKFPYSPGQEPNLPGNVDFLLQVCILDSLCSFFNDFVAEFCIFAFKQIIET